ncbi:MAG: sigma-54-dependent transcriptional regulator [bacterium]
MEKLLIVDGDEGVRFVLERAFRKEGYEVVSAPDVESGVEEIKRGGIRVAIVDPELPGIDGMDALDAIREMDRNVFVIIITAYGDMRTAIEAMKRGAYDYLAKPFDLNEAKVVVRKAFDTISLTKEASSLARELAERFDFDDIVGTSRGMREVYKAIGRVAESDVPVLIIGESGTGKELVAKAIHFHSRRGSKSFITVNCAMVPKALLESELFGHMREAFTGAVARRIGKFEMADGGTIFLDEVGDLDLDLQAKLLRVLQEHKFERVGSGEPIEIDVCIIAATNRDLEKLIEDGAFREDLYYELSVVPIHMPPLRERKMDIPLLVDHFIHKFNGEFGKGVKGVSPRALEILLAYDWPGNVRQLENVIKRAMVLEGGDIIMEGHIPRDIAKAVRGCGDDELYLFLKDRAENILASADGGVYERFLSLVERPLLGAALAKTGGNQVKAARILGINRNTLRKKMEKLGVEVVKSKKR